MDYSPLTNAEINFAGFPEIDCRLVASMDVDAPRLAAFFYFVADTSFT